MPEKSIIAEYWQEISAAVAGIGSILGFGAAQVRQGVKVNANCKAFTELKHEHRNSLYGVDGVTIFVPRTEMDRIEGKIDLMLKAITRVAVVEARLNDILKRMP